MKKMVFFASMLVFASTGVRAATLLNTIKAAVNDVKVVEQTGQCSKSAVGGGVGTACAEIVANCPAGTVLIPGKVGVSCGATGASVWYNGFNVTRADDGTGASCQVSGVDLTPDRDGNVSWFTKYDGYVSCAAGTKCSPVKYNIAIRCSSGKQSDWDSLGGKLKVK